MAFLNDGIRLTFPYILMTPIAYFISRRKGKHIFKQYIRFAILMFLWQLLSEFVYPMFGE